MKKYIFIIILSAIFIDTIFAQTDSVKKNALLFRIGTVSCFKDNLPPFYSLDYDRIFLSMNKMKCTASLGFSLSPWSFGIPLNINLLIGKRFCWEAGLGATYYAPLRDETYKKCLYLSVNPLGFRYTGKRGFVAFVKLGYFYGDFRIIGGDIFYDKNCYYKNKFYNPNIPVHSSKFNPNVTTGVGYAF